MAGCCKIKVPKSRKAGASRSAALKKQSGTKAGRQALQRAAKVSHQQRLARDAAKRAKARAAAKRRMSPEAKKKRAAAKKSAEAKRLAALAKGTRSIGPINMRKKAPCPCGKG